MTLIHPDRQTHPINLFGQKWAECDSFLPVMGDFNLGTLEEKRGESLNRVWIVNIALISLFCLVQLVRGLNRAVATHVALSALLGGSGDGPYLRDDLRRARRTAQEAAAAVKATLLPSIHEYVIVLFFKTKIRPLPPLPVLPSANFPMKTYKQ